MPRLFLLFVFCGLSMPVSDGAAQESGQTSQQLYEKGFAHYKKGELDKAAKAFQQSVDKDKNNAESWFQLGYALHAGGRLDESIKANRRAATFDQTRMLALYNLGCAYALKGEKDRAFGYLNQAVQAGYVDNKHIEKDSDLDSLRKDIRYKRLLNRIQGESVSDDFNTSDLLGRWVIVSETYYGKKSENLSGYMAFTEKELTVVTRKGSDGVLVTIPKATRPFKLDTSTETPTINIDDSSTGYSVVLKDEILTFSFSTENNKVHVIVLRRPQARGPSNKFEGLFVASDVSLLCFVEDSKCTGEMEILGKNYPIDGRLSDGELKGRLLVGKSRFDFRVKVLGEKLYLKSDQWSGVLVRKKLPKLAGLWAAKDFKAKIEKNDNRYLGSFVWKNEVLPFTAVQHGLNLRGEFAKGEKQTAFELRQGINDLVFVSGNHNLQLRPVAKTYTSTRSGIEFVRIESGTFEMGSLYFDQKPVHRVTITQPFFLGKFEVTQKQWKTVMGTEPWKNKIFVMEGAEFPATYANWNDAVEFCKKLSAREGRKFRLPTEAEWEFACRGGTTTTYSFGNRDRRLGDYGWFEDNSKEVGEDYAHRVGQKKPNPLGLYDLHGNVLEWCQDYYAHGFYRRASVKDPANSTTSSSRVLRGGDWNRSSLDCQSARRDYRTATLRNYFIGFRVVCEID